jgi:hypothetical protein
VDGQATDLDQFAVLDLRRFLAPGGGLIHQ